MNTVAYRIDRLRNEMAKRGIDAYLVPTDDFHASEYVGDFFKCREYITGFTGSAGTAVIMNDTAGLWTDGRYFLQAASELEGSGIRLYRSGEPDVPTVHEFLKDKLVKGQCLGFDGRTVTAREAELFTEELEGKGIVLRSDVDLIGEIWEGRPPMSCEPAIDLDVKWCGKSRTEKLADVRNKISDAGADLLILGSLDDIAWLLNIRGNDVKCNPVVLSYLIADKDKAMLFVQEKAVPESLRASLEEDGVELKSYDDICRAVSAIPAGSTVLLSKERVNSRICSSVPEGVRVIDADNPTFLMKAVKNETEMQNSMLAHVKDGAAVTKFVFWLKKTIGHETITELSAAEKLYGFRSENENFLGNSFDPIIAYGKHAAIIHYSADEKTNASLMPSGMVLVDTGGQYLEGTTDITRTIVLGDLSEKEKQYFTLVLKGHLRLLDARFRYGCTGINLDYLAREPLWRIGKDYNHGTGHGVGYFLNVHEGPNGFRWKAVPERRDCVVFEEGMITSDEPGFYEEGEFGIRHESLLLCKKDTVTDYGQFMRFEPLTMVPFDLDGIIPEMLDRSEKEVLNGYHRKVRETIAPYLEDEERDWLYQVTREI